MYLYFSLQTDFIKERIIVPVDPFLLIFLVKDPVRTQFHIVYHKIVLFFFFCCVDCIIYAV